MIVTVVYKSTNYAITYFNWYEKVATLAVTDIPTRW